MQRVMRIAVVLLIVPAVSIVPKLRARAFEDAAPAPTRQNVEELLKRLDAPLLTERSKAERGLLDLGPDALNYLPPPDLIPSVAVRDAVKRIRIQLERRAARESALASHVTLRGLMTVSQALAKVSEQTRNRIELADAAAAIGSQQVKIDYDNRPFWDCIDDIGQQLNLKPHFNLQRGALILSMRSAGESAPLVVHNSGPCRIVVQSAELHQIVGNSDHRLVRISARVTLEPRLRTLFLHFAARDIQGLDSAGNPLAPWNADAKYELPVGDAGREVPVQIDYLVPVDQPTTEVSVKGRILVQLAAATERIVFDQTSQTPGAVRRRGGVTVRLRDLKFDHQQNGKLNAAIGVAVSYDSGGPAFESHRTWMYHNAVYLETESGRRADFTDYDTAQQDNGAIAVEYRWEQLAAPATQYHFVYEAPTLILDLPVEIAMEKIPIANPTKP